MGVKNMFKKSSKLFDKEGFYIVLFVCLCIVAVAAVYMSRNNANTARKLAEGTKVEQPAPTDAKQVDNKDGKSVPATTTPAKNTGTSSTNTKTGSNTSKPAATTAAQFKLVMPVEGEISADKEYADTFPVEYPAWKEWRTHEAIDIMALVDSEVKAAYGGKVTKVNLEDIIVDDSIDTGYGVSIEIDHGNGYKTVYSNLSQEVKVKVGDVVKKGQVIGKVGATSSREANSAEGDHLHFALLKYNKTTKTYDPVDPNKFLPKQEAKEE